MVDSNYKFLDAFVGYPGRCHDAAVWRNSPLKKAIDSGRVKFPVEYHLLGDSAYPLEMNLMIPYKDNGFLTLQQKNYNTILSSTRVFVEQTFGILKKKFRILNYIEMHQLQLIKSIIMACIILHNIIMDNEELNPDDSDGTENDNDQFETDDYDTSNLSSTNNEARRKRERIATLLSA